MESLKMMWASLACVLLCVTTFSYAAQSTGDLTFDVSPLLIVDAITEELSIDCRPSSSLENGGTIGLMVDIFRDGDLIVRQRLSTQYQEDNRTSADGHLRMEDDEPTFVSLTVLDPTFTEAGVYSCRYIYIDANQQVQNLMIAANVTCNEIPPPEVLPPLVPEVQIVEEIMGCNCSEIWEEINKLKEAMDKKLEVVVVPEVAPVVQAPPPVAQDGCHVSFSAKFPGRRSFPIESESLAPFHETITNHGNAFNTDKAAFVAPCAGQYFFSLTIRSEQKLDSGYVDGAILVDGQEMARTSVFVDSPINNYESGSNGAVIILQPGQEVKVVVKTTSFGRLRGAHYSIFSGFFLSP